MMLQTVKLNRRQQITPHLLQDLLVFVDEIQAAAMVGHLDETGQDALNVLDDIHLTVEETINELKRRLGGRH